MIIFYFPNKFPIPYFVSIFVKENLQKEKKVNKRRKKHTISDAELE